MPRDDRPVVYSTEFEDPEPCKKCGRVPCVCQAARSLPPEQQTAFIRRETKGRGGKTVITISNLVLTPSDMKKLAKKLKKSCSTGGTVKDDRIEIQGEHRDQINALLQKEGFRTKFTGG